MDTLNVLLLTEVTEHASTHLRGLEPLKVLESLGLVKFGVHTIKEVIVDNPDAPEHSVDNEDSPVRKFARDIAACDVIVIPQTSALGWTKFIEDWREAGKVVIYDLDDDVRVVHPLSPTYLARGIHDVSARVTVDGKEQRVWLWKDGKEGFDIQKNLKWQAEFLEGLQQADAITCPTRRFADIISKDIHPKSFVLPNCVDTTLWKPGKHPGWPKDEFRILWHGGDSHRPDVGPAAAGVGKFLREHPNAVFVLVGAPLAEWRVEIPSNQLEYWDWSSYDAHPWRLMGLGADVGLCPVTDHPFNYAKSPLKWEEYAACGVPSICSKSPPYSDTVRSGEDGVLVVDHPSNWEEALRWAYNEPESRLAMGARARARIEADFSLENKAMEWYAVWHGLVEERKASKVVI